MSLPNKFRINIRMSGIGGQGVVTAAHIICVATAKDGLTSVANPFFGAEKKMAPVEAYVRISTNPIYDRGETVYPQIVMIFHPQVITMGKSYTRPFYDGLRQDGTVIINCDEDILPESDKAMLESKGATVYAFSATSLALELAGTELSTNMAMIGAVAGLAKLASMDAFAFAVNERFSKKFVASGGTASLDEAIKRKFAKKEELLQKNADTIIKSYELASAWLEEHQKVAAPAGA